MISKLPFITFLKNHRIYLLHCICDLALYIFENIHGTKHQIEGTVYKACYVNLNVEISIRQRKYPNTVTLFGTCYI